MAQHQPLRIFFVSLVAGALANVCAPASELRLREPVIGELRAADVHRYTFRATPGQYIHVVLEQKGIDAAISLVAPDGAEITSSDRPNGRFGAEEVAHVATAAGEYIVKVTTVDSVGQGSYELRLEAVRAPRAEDHAQIAALSTYAQARVLQRNGNDAARKESLILYTEAFKRAGECGNEYLQAIISETMGMVAAQSGEFREALSLWTRAQAMYAKLGDANRESVIFINLGGMHDVFGDLKLAQNYYSRALEHFREAGDELAEARILNNLGKLHHDMADWAKAMEFYGQALPIFRKLKNRRLEAITLANLGVAYNSLGAQDKAIVYLEQAIQIWRETGDKAGEAEALGNLGAAYVRSARVDKGIETYEKSLAVQRAIGNPRTQAITLNYLGFAYAQLRLPDKSLEKLKEAVTLSRSVEDRRTEGLALLNMGSAYQMSSNAGASVEHYTLALNALRSVGDRNACARALEGMAIVERDRGNLKQARSHIESAIELVDQVREHTGDQQIRASYFAANLDSYEIYLDLLMEQHRQEPGRGYDILALQASERARARSLVEMLAEARVDFRKDIDPQLLERERNVSQLLRSKSERLMAFMGRAGSQTQAAELKNEITSLEAEYEQVQSSIRTRSAKYASVTHPTPVSVTEMQRSLLDPQSVLLHYALGSRQSYLWSVTRESVRTYMLPGRDTIEPLVRELLSLLTARSQPVRGEEAAERKHRIERADRMAPEAAKRLTDIVLAPAWTELKGRRILVASDGALQHVPFSMLPEPGSTPERPLVAGHEVVVLPSASTLAIMRREMAARPRATRLIAVLADPVFGKDDPRAGGEFQAGQSTRSRILEHVNDDETTLAPESAVIPRLPFTRKEAERILAAAPKSGNLRALDFDASLRMAASPELSEYQYLHFATHGYADPDRPGLSSLVLSLVDRRGNPQPGFLRAGDIYNLKLPAELVVLSACQTGLGKQIRGEGVMGLTRAFLYAGAKRVVVSLWNVNDEATTELMGNFYERLWRRNLTSSAALREAQVAMWKSKRWSAPYYWAAFVQQGEWK
jgi:CHAT domain-containing protein/tetratricopeptide (TPR) repeat protein